MIHVINSFQGEYRFLSNFAAVDVILDKVVYPSVEHAYQAAKTWDHNERAQFSGSRLTAGQAKRAGSKVTMRDDWILVRLSIMRSLVEQKFEQEPFRIQLRLTADSRLAEGNTWNDTYWGICRGYGFKHLGKILMEVRDNLEK